MAPRAIKWASVLFISTIARAESPRPYYPGTYNLPGVSASSSTQVVPTPTPPVVYQEVPVYRRARRFRRPEWASPDDPALGPWPWNADIGGGPAIVTGSGGRITDGSNFVFGMGYNATPENGFVMEFMNTWLGVTGKTLAEHGAVAGTAHTWSFTINPIHRFQIGGPIGVYVIGGGGFYERSLLLDEPTGFFFPSVVTVRHNDDTGGFNIGTGLTWNMGWGAKFFLETRYHYIFTSGNATQILPVTFGIRW